MSNAMPNVSFQIAYADVLISYNLYVAVGAVAIATNACIVMIFWSSHILRVKYQLLIALAIANLINGVGFVLAGAIKGSLFNAVVGYKFPSATVWDCAIQSWPALQIIGAQWPAFITLMLGTERFAAVHYPIWYKVNIHAKQRFKMILISIVLSLASIGVAFAQAYIFFRSKRSNFLCSISNAFDKYYTTWNYIVTVFGHSIAFLLNANAFLTAKSKSHLVSSGLSATMRKEITLVRLMLGLAGFSVLLISIPNIILWGQSWIWTVGTNSLGYIDVSFCCSSAINIIIYTLFNKDFRTRLVYFTTCGRGQKVATEVHRISIHPRASIANSKSRNTAFRSDGPVVLIPEDD